MALYEGFGLSGVTLLGSKEEEKAVDSRNPLSGVSMLGTKSPADVVDPRRIGDTGQAMQEYDAPLVEDVRDFMSGVKDHLTHGESWSAIMNLYKAFLPRTDQYVPVKDAEGNLSHLRTETPEEQRVRINAHKELMKSQYGIDSNSAEGWTAKVGSLMVDPLTWTPLGKTYLRAGAIGGTLGATDMYAYQMAEDGKIDPEMIGVATVLGTIMGPTFKLFGDKAVQAYAKLRGKGLEHPEAVKELMKIQEQALPEVKRLTGPAPQKRLPAPEAPLALPAPGKTEAPYFVNTAGEVVAKPSAPQKPGLREIEVLRARERQLDLAENRVAEGVENVKNTFNQGGGVSQNVLMHLASSGLGAAVGGAVDGKEGAAIGAAAGFGAPLVWRHAIVKPIKKLSQWAASDSAGAFARGKFASSPTATLKLFGKAGRKMSDAIEEMNQNIDMAIGGKLVDFEKAVGHLNTDQMQRVRSLLNHTLKPSAATKVEVAAAKQLRREFNQVLDEAVNTGVMTSKKANQLKLNAAKKGYFPRVYNTELLATKTGKEEWVKAWTGFTGNKADLASALESIVGEKDIVAKMVARGNGTITRGDALNLLRIMRNRGQNARSAHLEHARKINEQAERILEPFMIKDPRAAIARYYQDAYRRIESSRVFGKQVPPKGPKGIPKWNPDGYAEDLMTSISQDFGGEAENLARQTFWNSVGDSNSEILRKYTQLGEVEGQLLRGLGSFETAVKLPLAAMANMFQATVNGMTRFLNVSGNPVRSLQLFTRGLLRSLGKEGKEFADRSGAALETTLMEMAGEASRIGQVGEKVLKYTGFIAAERFQRRLGANLGRVYAEELAEKATKVQQGMIKGRQAARIQAQMKELGLPVNRMVTDTDIVRAGLKFSNDINFRNTPDKLPLAWQTPYGRLLTKFKSFAFHQGRFVKNDVIKPFLRGNPWPLIWYAGPASVIGMSVDELRRMIKGDDRELSQTERYLRGVTMIGGMGILQDTISQFHRGPAEGLASLAGPAAGDVGRYAHGAATLVTEGDPKNLLNAVAKTFVLPGQTWIIDEFIKEGKKRGRNGARSGNRSGSRGGSR